MLSANVLSSDAELNKYDVINSLAFIPGEKDTLFLQLFQPQRKDLLRYVAPSTATLTCHFQNKDMTTTDVAFAAMTGDASIWSGTLTTAITNKLSGGNFTFTLDLLGDGTQLIQGWVQNGLTLVITGNC